MNLKNGTFQGSISPLYFIQTSLLKTCHFRSNTLQKIPAHNYHSKKLTTRKNTPFIFPYYYCYYCEVLLLFLLTLTVKFLAKHSWKMFCFAICPIPQYFLPTSPFLARSASGAQKADGWALMGMDVCPKRKTDRHLLQCYL